MLRNTQKFDINGEVLTVQKVHGPLDLARYFHEVEAKKDAVAKFKKNPNMLSQLFRPKTTVDKRSETQMILYTNGLHQHSLIVTDGKNHYFYDLVKGAAASFDVKEALGAGLVDVSGKEARANLEEAKLDVGRAREMSARHLPNLETAIQYAVQQIKVAQQQKREYARTAGPGASAGG